MSPLILFVGILLLGSVCTANPWDPIPRPIPGWIAMHEKFVKNTQENASRINCVFIGSSSIEYWATTGKEIWDEKYHPLGCVNYGIRGDRTQQVIWRVTNGELDGLNPKLIIVYAGANNIPTNSTIEEVLRGVTTMLGEIRAKLPKTRILYVEINPRGDGDIEHNWNRIAAVNSETQKLNDGDSLTSLNFFWDLAKAWLVIKKELYEDDLLHLNKDGYVQWDASWNSTFWDLWNRPQNIAKYEAQEIFLQKGTENLRSLIV